MESAYSENWRAVNFLLAAAINAIEDLEEIEAKAKDCTADAVRRALIIIIIIMMIWMMSSVDLWDDVS